MVELKALIKLEDVHLAQAMNYLEAYKMEIGLLLNFGGRSLEFKRVHNNRLWLKDLILNVWTLLRFHFGGQAWFSWLKDFPDYAMNKESNGISPKSW